jgi:hypothetical protein
MQPFTRTGMFGLQSVLASDAVNTRSTLSHKQVEIGFLPHVRIQFVLQTKVGYLPTKLDNFHNMKLIVYTTLAKECGMP